MMVVMFQMMGMYPTSAPVTATSLAFYPQENIIAVGFEDSTIQIYEICEDPFWSLVKVCNIDMPFLFHPSAR